MKRGISLYNTTSSLTGKKGTRCLICTGCGRCPGVIRGMQVVTEKLELPPLSLQNPEGIRLMTVDIGTTTIAMQLYDADGKVVDSFPSVNPQVSYGADVLSRIEAARDPGKAADMQKKVLGLIEKGVQRFSKKLQEKESIQMVIAANTTMTYLLMGWDPAELGRAPFRVSHCGAVDTQIAGISCHIIPGLSAFVGGDITAGILACQMLEQEEPMLLIDLGTNGEMALGNRQKLYACATAAGPAFEGGANRGIWGADMVRLLQKLLEEGLMTAEAFVTLTNMDEENVFLSLFAKTVSNAKLIAKVNRLAFDDVIDNLDIGSVIYPKYITADYILQYVRAMQNSIGSNIETLYHILDNQAEALEFAIRENSPVTGIPLSELNLKKNLLVGYLNRNGQVKIPRGQDTIQVGDTVIIVTSQKGLRDITDILEK